MTAKKRRYERILITCFVIVAVSLFGYFILYMATTTPVRPEQRYYIGDTIMTGVAGEPYVLRGISISNCSKLKIMTTYWVPFLRYDYIVYDVDVINNQITIHGQPFIVTNYDKSSQPHWVQLKVGVVT